MATMEDVKQLLKEVLSLDGSVSGWTEATPLLGSVPQLDSLAVVHVITAMEEKFRFNVYDDEISADVFATLGDLLAFVQRKCAEAAA